MMRVMIDTTDWQSRTQRLLGTEAVDALSRAHVIIVGLGGVGGAAAEAVVRAGVGRVTFVDGDVFTASNLNRQILATLDTLGESKAETAVKRARRINPVISASAIARRITPEDVGQLLDGAPDIVIDAIDDVKAKTALILACKQRGVTVGSSMGTGNRVHPEMLCVCDITETKNDPLARVMRRELKKVGVTALTVVCSHELPRHPPADENGGHAPASCSFVPPVAGYLLAGAMLRALALDGGQNRGR